MSLNKAEKVSISMTKLSHVPPPRSVDDILSFLQLPDEIDPKVAEQKEILKNMLPLETSSHVRLAGFYHARGERADQLALSKQALEDRRLALYFDERTLIRNPLYLNRLGLSELYFGNFQRGIQFLEQSKGKGEWASDYSNLVRAYLFTGDLEKAENIKKEGVYYCNGLSGPWPKIHAAWMTAMVLESEGKYTDAEKHFRSAQDIASYRSHNYPTAPIIFKSFLAQNLMKQRRLIEAEFEMRKALDVTIGLFGKKAGITGTMISDLGEVIHNQGRLQEAEKLLKAGIQIMKASSDIPKDCFVMAQSYTRLGHVLADQKKYYQAMIQYNFVKSQLANNQYLLNEGFALERNPNYILSLIKTNRVDEAMGHSDIAFDINFRQYGQYHYLTTEILALRAIAFAKLNRLPQAGIDLYVASLRLQGANLAEQYEYSVRQRFKIIVEFQIDLFSEIHGSPLENQLSIKALTEAFKLADASRNHLVQSALTASNIRMTAENPELSYLIRKEQDIQHQIETQRSIIWTGLAMSSYKNDQTAVQKSIENLNNLMKAQSALKKEIKKSLPRYSFFTAPPPSTVAVSTAYLRKGEALISIYSTEDSTYIWALNHRGNVKFSKANIGRKRIAQIVAELRHALDSNPKTLGDIPEFDLKLAYELYEYLLKPVKDCWQRAEELIIVAPGPLSHIPFSILPMSNDKFGTKEQLLFEKYQKIPWLIRKFAITRLPSVSSMVTLRNVTAKDSGRKAFVGFGDPIFNQDQTTTSDKQAGIHLTENKEKQKSLNVRRIVVAETVDPGSQNIVLTQLSLLNRIPDTADEIRGIANVLEADETEDVFLGKRASELQVKNMKLSDRRVIAFATHALLPGDIKGLFTPALALTSPDITAEDEDGLLTLEEIFKLRLNADWVILSGCNTASGSGAGADAVSGLGRAFFYAGTRSILVSLWPVESTSAKEITTNIFQYQKEDKNLNRSKALRKSILKLIDGPGLTDNDTGKHIASYAHPLFWAPFILVGDNGTIETESNTNVSNISSQKSR